MQNRRDILHGQEGCRKGGMQDKWDAGLEGCRKGGDAGKQGWRNRVMKERRYSRPDRMRHGTASVQTQFSIL